MAGVIDSYLASLQRDLDFDPALARRLTEEVESHLRDAAEADPAWPSDDAERRAVERFGLAREIAAQFAADAVAQQSRRTWLTVIAAVVMTFVAMRLRVMWLSDIEITAASLAPFVDRYAFASAIAVATVGWFAFRSSLLPLAVCLVGLAASIAAGFVRADLFTGGAPLHVLLPAAAEVALVGLLAWRVVDLGRRVRRTENLKGIGT
jgi:hypothetical protein